MECIFCGQIKRATREHVYPVWVRKGLGATGPTTITRTKPAINLTRQEKTTGLTWVLHHSICRDCNTGWMSTKLEDEVKDCLLPAMLGQWAAFSVEQQRLIAAWAVKTALLFELKAKEDGGQVTLAPQSNLNWLYQHREHPEAPLGSQVWIAAVDAELGTVDAQPGWHNVTTSLPPFDMQFYAVTFAVGYLVFQVIGQDFRESDHQTPSGGPLYVHQRPDWLLEYVNSIWPARSEVIDWPRSRRFKRADLSRFAGFEGTMAARLVPFPRLGQS